MNWTITTFHEGHSINNYKYYLNNYYDLINWQILKINFSEALGMRQNSCVKADACVRYAIFWKHRFWFASAGADGAFWVEIYPIRCLVRSTIDLILSIFVRSMAADQLYHRILIKIRQKMFNVYLDSICIGPKLFRSGWFSDYCRSRLWHYTVESIRYCEATMFLSFQCCRFIQDVIYGRWVTGPSCFLEYPSLHPAALYSGFRFTSHFYISSYRVVFIFIASNFHQSFAASWSAIFLPLFVSRPSSVFELQRS